MKLYEVQERDNQLVNSLLNAWKNSVHATHLFLSDSEVKRIKEYVPQAIKSVKNLVVAETDNIVGFMGTENNRLEMLFILPQKRGKGIGKQLVQYGVQNYDINEVTVNEDNPQTVGFYKHLGFETYKRTDCDEEGNPYPLLYMKLVG